MLNVKDSTYAPDLLEEAKYHLDQWEYHASQAATAYAEYLLQLEKSQEHRIYFYELRNKFNSEAICV
jgi:hypothetical protein